MQEDVKEKGCLLDGFPRAPDQVTWKKWRKDARRNMEKGVSKDFFNIAFDIYTHYINIYKYMRHTHTQEPCSIRTHRNQPLLSSIHLLVLNSHCLFPKAQAMVDAGLEVEKFLVIKVPDDTLVERGCGRRLGPQGWRVFFDGNLG